MLSPHDLGLLKAAYTVKETESLLSVSHTTIYNLLKNNKLKAIKLNSKTLILATEIAAFLSGLQG